MVWPKRALQRESPFKEKNEAMDENNNIASMESPYKYKDPDQRGGKQRMQARLLARPHKHKAYRMVKCRSSEMRWTLLSCAIPHKQNWIDIMGEYNTEHVFQ